MTDGPKVPARTSDAETSKIQFFSDASHEKSNKYPDEPLLNPRIDKPFTANQEFLIFNAN